MKTWSCKIGEMDADRLPRGADYPMRRAIEAAYREITGREPDFLFSGWGAELTESERAVVENRLPADSRPPGWVCDREDCQGRPAEIVARATQAEVVERLVPKHVRDAIGYAEEGRASHVAWAEHLDAGTCEFCTNDVVDTAGDAAHQREWVAKYDAILAVLREHADRVAASRLLDSIARISDEVNHERRVAAVQHALRYRAEAAHLLSLLDTPTDSQEDKT